MADEKTTITDVSVNKTDVKEAVKKVATTATVATKAAVKPAAKPAAKKVAKKTTAKKVTKPAAKKVAKKVAKKTTAKKTTTKKAPVKKVATKKVAAKKTDNRLEQLQSLLQENLGGLNTDKAEAAAKNIWLAGLGAYSRTFEELTERQEEIQEGLQERVKTLNKESQKVFEDLVSRGKEIQNDAESALHQGRENLEDRVDDFKQRFGGGLSSFVDIPTRLRDAAEKIEEISDRLQKKK